MSPVTYFFAAFIGGVIGQSIIRVVTWRFEHGHRKDQTHRGDPRPDLGTQLRTGAAAVTGIPSAVDTPAEDPGAGLEPVRAWKVARLTGNPALPFKGYNDVAYGIEAVAECHAQSRYVYTIYRREHDIRCPDEGCTCGFYARTEQDRPIPEPGYVVLEVELYGRVIVGTNGYRAEKQRVLAVWASHNHAERCSISVVAGIYDGRPYHRTCPHAAHFFVAGHPHCAEHALETGKRMAEYHFTPPDTGTEWRWIEDEETA